MRGRGKKAGSKYADSTLTGSLERHPAHHHREAFVDKKPSSVPAHNLSRQAIRLLAHAKNRVGKFVTEMLIRRYYVARSLTQGHRAVNLSGYEAPTEAARLAAESKLPILAPSAQLAGIFIELLKNKESSSQLWLASHYNALGLDEREFVVFANLFGGHVDEKYSEARIDADTARSMAQKCVLRFEVMLMESAPNCLTSLMASSSPAPSWVPKELDLSKPSQHKIDSTFAFAKQALKRETRINDSALQSLSNGLLSWFNPAKRSALSIENSPVYIQSLKDGVTPLQIYIVKPHSLPGTKGIYDQLPEKKFDLDDYPLGQVLRLSVRSRAPADSYRLSSQQTQKVLSHWLAVKVLTLFDSHKFFDQTRDEYMTFSQRRRKAFISFFEQFLKNMSGVREKDIIASLMKPQSVVSEFMPRVEKIAKMFYENTEELFIYDKLLNNTHDKGSNDRIFYDVDSVDSDHNAQLIELWGRIAVMACREDENTKRAEFLKSTKETGDTGPRR